MSDLTIPDVDDDLRQRLEQRAALHGVLLQRLHLLGKHIGIQDDHCRLLERRRLADGLARKRLQLDTAEGFDYGAYCVGYIPFHPRRRLDCQRIPQNIARFSLH